MSIKHPPIFHPEEGDDYTSWKTDIGIWKMLTDTKPEKIGAAVYFSLKGKAREVVRKLTETTIGGATGYVEIIKELDNVYLADATTRTFTAFKEFYEFRREDGMDFSKFIVVYESRYLKVTQSEIGDLPSGVQAFFLLKAANLTPESEKLARATGKLEYTDMRDKLMKIFGDPGVLDNDDMVPEVKPETYYGYSKDRNRRRGRGGYRGSNASRGGKFQESQGECSKEDEDKSDKKQNPTSNGRVLRCYECNSTKHLVYQCPHRKEAVFEQQLNVHVTLISSEPEKNRDRKGLLYESFGKAELDSGCSKTVAGQLWCDEYMRLLTEDEKERIVEKRGSSVFRFGDGKESLSTKLMTIPVCIGKKKVLLDVDIVQNEIPLLSSKGAMKQLRMKIDFKNDTANIDGTVLKL